MAPNSSKHDREEDGDGSPTLKRPRTCDTIDMTNEINSLDSPPVVDTVDTSNNDSPDAVVEVPRVVSPDSLRLLETPPRANDTRAAIPNVVRVAFDIITKFSEIRNSNGHGNDGNKVTISYGTNVQEIFQKVCTIGKFDSDELTADTRAILTKFQPILVKMIESIHNKWLLADKKPVCTVKYGDDDTWGVYGVLLDLPTGIKYGMSRNVVERVKFLKRHLYAFKIVNCTQLRDIIGDDLVDQVEELGFPGIQYHKAHRESARKLYRMHVFEAYVTAAHRSQSNLACVTKTIMERFVQNPLPLSPISPNDIKLVREFLKDLQKYKCLPILTWKTMKSKVEEMAKASHPLYLGTRIRKRSDDGDGDGDDNCNSTDFLKIYWIHALLGKENCEKPVDSVQDPPKQQDYDDFLKCVSDHKLLTGPITVEKTKRLEKAYQKIKDENAESYVRPTDDDLAAGFIQQYELYDLAKDPKMYFIIEHYTLKVVKKKNQKWYREHIGYEEENLELASDFYRITFITTTKTRRRLIVTPSYFMAFSPEPNTIQGRITAVVSLLAFFDLLYNADSEYANQYRRVCVAYMMALDASDENRPLRSEASYTVPKELFRGPLPNCVTVSKNMGICVHGHFYLQFKLENDQFRRLLNSQGMLCKPCGDELPLWPSHYAWKCPGTPACGSIPHQPCNNENPKEATACMVGANNKNHPFYGLFLCRHCYHRMEILAREWLEIAERNGTITDEGKTMLQALRVRSLRDRNSTNLRNQRKERNGEQVELEKERTINNANCRKDKEERQGKNKERDATRKHTGSPSRDVKGLKGERPYPEAFEEKLGQGILEFFKRRPEIRNDSHPRQTSYRNLRILFGRILEREYQHFPTSQQDGVNKNDKILWRTFRFMTVVKKYMYEHPKNVTEDWVLKSNFHPTIRQGEIRSRFGWKQDAVIEEIVNELCAETTVYPNVSITNKGFFAPVAK